MHSGDVTLQSSRPAGASSPQNRELLTKFRQQLHAVGSIWIMTGAMLLLLGLHAVFGNPEFLIVPSDVADVALVLGFAWLVLGVLTCRKEMSALTVALVFSYVVMALSLANGRSGGGVLILAIIQGHRVRGFAKKLTAEGIVLTTKP